MSSPKDTIICTELSFPETADMISPFNYCFEATVNLTLGHNFQGCRLEGVGEGNPPAVMMNTDASTLVINIFRKTECTKNCAAVVLSVFSI